MISFKSHTSFWPEIFFDISNHLPNELICIITTIPLIFADNCPGLDTWGYIFPRFHSSLWNFIEYGRVFGLCSYLERLNVILLY